MFYNYRSNFNRRSFRLRSLRFPWKAYYSQFWSSSSCPSLTAIQLTLF